MIALKVIFFFVDQNFKRVTLIKEKPESLLEFLDSLIKESKNELRVKLKDNFVRIQKGKTPGQASCKLQQRLRGGA